jgi:hypothetical protein
MKRHAILQDPPAAVFYPGLRPYCRGERAITRLKAVLKALSDS